MNDELDAISSRYSDFQKSCSLISTNELREVILIEYSNGVAVGMQHLMVINPVFSGTDQKYGIHTPQVILTHMGSGSQIVITDTRRCRYLVPLCQGQ